MKRLLIAAALAAAAAPAARAGDSGDLVFPADRVQRFRSEIVYERTHRNISVNSETPTRNTSSKADAFLLRIQTDLIPDARLDFDVGALGPSSGSFGFIGGAGLRYQAYDRGPLRIGAFGQVRYAPRVTSRVTLNDVGTVDVDHDWLEGDVGLLASYRYRVADHTALVPYAGPVLSVLRMSGTISDSARDGARFRAEERWLVGAAVGLGLEFHGVNGIRLEMRVLDHLNFSVAAAMTF